jgi:hypothetical protein
MGILIAFVAAFGLATLLTHRHLKGLRADNAHLVYVGYEANRRVARHCGFDDYQAGRTTSYHSPTPEEACAIEPLLGALPGEQAALQKKIAFWDRSYKVASFLFCCSMMAVLITVFRGYMEM